MVGFELGSASVTVGFVQLKSGAEFFGVLEAEFPFVGFFGVVFPEAAVGYGQAGILLAFLVDPTWKIAFGQVGPVVVFAFGLAEFGPPSLGVFPLGFEKGPEGGAVDHDAVVEVHFEGGIDFAGWALFVHGWGAAFGDVPDLVGEVLKFLG